MAKIFVIDDEAGVCRAFEELLSERGHDVTAFASAERCLEALDAAAAPDVVVSDLRLPGLSGLELMGRIREKHPDMPVVIITAHGTMDAAVESMRQGAFDYLLKPLDIGRVRQVVERAAQSVRSAVAHDRADDVPTAGIAMVGVSAHIQEVFKKIGQLAHSDGNVLITGPSGSGKELVARAIHYHSSRRDGPFVAVNCASIPEGLFESELYGHEKGAYTGASRTVIGKAEMAAGGVLFLDEIGEIGPSVQAKLLRFIDERQIERLGGNNRISLDVRIVAATNRDLSERMRAGIFRDDLYFRLNVVGFALKPLAERPEDVPPLAAYFLENVSRTYGKTYTFSDGALKKLAEYRWPGNARELKNAVEFGAALTPDGVIRSEDLPPNVRSDMAAGGDDLEAMAARAIDRYGADGDLMKTVVGRFERAVIREVYRRNEENQVRTARALGINRNTLRAKLNE